MSNEKQEIRTPDGADESSIYYSPGNVFFAGGNDSSRNACSTPTGDVQQEETYVTPRFEKFLQWRQNHSLENSSFTPQKMMMRDESTPEASSCDESLIEQINMLSLSARKYPRTSASTPTKVDTTLTNVEGIPEGSYVREDLSAWIPHIQRATNERTSGLNEISAEDKTRDELTSDYSTMESTVPDGSSSSKVTSDSSIDQLPPRGTKQSDRPSREDTIVDSAEPRTKEARNPVNAESIRLADHSPTSPGKPSFIGDGEAFETDTFDDLYNQNVEFAQHYLERMAKKPNGGCFVSHWSKKIVSMSSLCRSPQRSKKSKERDCADVRTSPVRENARSSTDVLKRGSPTLKLRFARKKGQDRIAEKPRPGNAAFTLAGNGRSMILACRAAITTIPTLSAVCFCIGPTDVARYCPRRWPCCRPPVTYSLANRYRRELKYLISIYCALTICLTMICKVDM